MNTFEDWLLYMNKFIHPLEDLLDFKDHYQNGLSFEDNFSNFITYLNEDF